MKYLKYVAFLGLVMIAIALLHRGTMSGQTTYMPTMSSTSPPSLTQSTNTTVTGSWPSWTVGSAQGAVLTETTASIGGSLLVLGGCNTATATVSGATTSMVAVTSPTTALANGIQWQAAVTSANTVTVYECALLSITPASTTFNVRVIQ